MDNIESPPEPSESREESGNNFSCSYSFVVYDKDGNIVNKSLEIDGKCFLKAFIQIWYHWFCCGYNENSPTAQTRACIDILGSPFDIVGVRATFTPDLVVCSENDLSCGIVVGNGSTPTAIDDNALESQYLGDVFGYAATAVVGDVPTISGNVLSITFLRLFENITDISQNISEIGLYAKRFGLTRYYAMLRDVLVTNISVPPGGLVGIKYTISLNS